MNNIDSPICVTYKYSLILILSILLISSCSKKREAAEEEEVIRPVRYITVTKTQSDTAREFTGIVRPSMESTLSFKVGGTLESLNVSVGDQVKQGDILAQLDDTDYKIDLDQAVSSKNNVLATENSAKTNVMTAKLNFERIEKLYESQSESLSELEKAENNFKTANAQLTAAVSQIVNAESKIEAAKNQLKYTILSAPFAGIITSISIEENEVIKSGNIIMTISALGRSEIKVNIPDNYISKVWKGQEVAVSFSNVPNSKFHGTVDEIAFSAGSNSTYPVKVLMDDNSSEIRPGMTGTTVFYFEEIGEKGSPKIHVPPSAVGEDSSGRFVYVINPIDKNIGIARKRIIEIGSLSELGFDVVSGIQEGELVATAGLQVLLENMKVRLR